MQAYVSVFSVARCFAIFWALCCLCVLDLRILFLPLVSSNSWKLLRIYLANLTTTATPERSFPYHRLECCWWIGKPSRKMLFQLEKHTTLYVYTGYHFDCIIYEPYETMLASPISVCTMNLCSLHESVLFLKQFDFIYKQPNTCKVNVLDLENICWFSLDCPFLIAPSVFFNVCISCIFALFNTLSAF
jgi:hypothetical protein